MNTEQIQSFVMRYLEAEKCSIIEKHPAYVTVKLSPSADQALTNRPYYWSFVERTGTEPETVTCTFIFDPEAYKALHPAPQGPAQAISTAAPPGMAGSPAPPSPSAPQGGSVPGSPPPGAGSGDTILGRYFGFVPTSYTARVPRDEVTFGSRKLSQMFEIAGDKGRFVRLFEAYKPQQNQTVTLPYETWFVVNYKAELACDMKRSELHSLGIHMATGEIREHCHRWLETKALTPRLPAHVYITPDRITLPRAAIYLEEYMEQKLRQYDHGWAAEAQFRKREELERIRGYYEPLLKECEPEQRAEIEGQYNNRMEEIEWQYGPRIRIAAINCGLFHLPVSKPQLH